MQFQTLFVLTGLIAAVAAVPVEQRQIAVCSTTPNCCAVDVLGVADLDCETPPNDPQPTDLATFQAECAAIGKQATCCVLDILSQALLCSAP